MSKNNDVTGDRIVNTKGDSKKYKENWDKIFSKKDVLDEMSELDQELGLYDEYTEDHK